MIMTDADPSHRRLVTESRSRSSESRHTIRIPARLEAAAACPTRSGPGSGCHGDDRDNSWAALGRTDRDRHGDRG